MSFLKKEFEEKTLEKEKEESNSATPEV